MRELAHHYEPAQVMGSSRIIMRLVSLFCQNRGRSGTRSPLATDEAQRSPKQKSKKKKELKKKSLRDLWGIIKYASICIIGVLEGKKKEGVENLSEEMTKNLPNLEKETVFRCKKHIAFPTK